MSDSGTGNDKLYIIVILAMIGCFIYWYQSRLDASSYCERCQRLDSKTVSVKKEKNRSSKTQKKSSKKKKSINASKSNTKDERYLTEKPKSRTKKGKKKSVTFKDDEESDISLDSLDSSDHASVIKHDGDKNDDDTDSDLDSIDM